VFWSAVWGGLKNLALFQVWIVILVYAVSMLGFMFLIAHATRDSRAPNDPSPAGCVTYMVGGTLLQGILMALAVALLMPILLGQEFLTPVSRINWGPLLRGGLLVAVGGVVLTLLPLIGAVVTKVPGALAFIQGVFLFRMDAHWLIDQPLAATGLEPFQLYPGFLASTGFLLIGVAVTGLVVLGVIALATALSRGDEASGLLAPAVGAACAIIPLLMYGSYVSQTLARMSVA
jgi:hypothetical protein